MLQKSTQDLKEEMPNVFGGFMSKSNCVTSEPLSNYTFVNNAAADLAFERIEKTSEDPFFPGDLNDYRSLDLPTGEPE